jgi:hypothetical protein
MKTGAGGSQYNGIAIYKVEVRKNPRTSLVATILPDAGKSFRKLTLIEPDRHELPLTDQTNVALLTFAELNLTSGPNSEVQKYATLRDVASLGTVLPLSVAADGSTQKWDWNAVVGTADVPAWYHYVKASGYWTGSGWRFYGLWHQPKAGKMRPYTNWVDLDD